jgi:oligopeptide/dipeptide ABC transporter ATP-binding protein
VSAEVQVRDLVKHFELAGHTGAVHAVNAVSFNIRPGETLALVGESGSGKSTLGRCLLRLVEPTSGTVTFDGLDVGRMPSAKVRSWRANAQMVFQDPFDALSPRMRVRSILEEPLRLHTRLDSRAREHRMHELLDYVRLGATYLERLPRELSGGEAQRVAIARSLATEPGFLVLDEPTSSLDLSVRASVLGLLDTLQDRLGLTYLLISHDLHAVSAHSDRVAVMYLGSIVEIGPAHTVFTDPQHPYTQALLSASLPADPAVRLARVPLKGEIPSSINLPQGCLFVSRCPIVKKECLEARPAHRAASSDHTAACIRLDDGSNHIPRTAEPAPQQPGAAPAPHQPGAAPAPHQIDA